LPKRWKKKRILKEAFKVAALAPAISDEEARFIDERGRLVFNPEETIGSFIKPDACQKLFDETATAIDNVYMADYCRGYLGVFNLKIIKKEADRFVPLLGNFSKKMIGHQALELWLMSVASVTKVKFGTFCIELLEDFLLILHTNLVLICTKEAFARKKYKYGLCWICPRSIVGY
jgi:hypothetical protein